MRYSLKIKGDLNLLPKIYNKKTKKLGKCTPGLVEIDANVGDEVILVMSEGNEINFRCTLHGLECIPLEKYKRRR